MSSKIVKLDRYQKSLKRLRKEDKLHAIIEVLERIENKIHLLPIQVELNKNLSNEKRKSKSGSGCISRTNG